MRKALYQENSRKNIVGGDLLCSQNHRHHGNMAFGATCGHFEAIRCHSKTMRRVGKYIYLHLVSGNTKYSEMEIISMDKRVFDDMAGRVESIEGKIERLCAGQKSPGMKRWFDNQDVCVILGISKRTLQTYREKGLLPFSQIRHKILYRPDDVEKLLQSSHHPNE